MYEVTQEIPFCYGHRLLLHAGKCARLHGHNGVARLTLRAAALLAIDEKLVTLPFHPTAENLARMIYDHAKAEGFPVSKVQLVEQPGSVATYAE